MPFKRGDPKPANSGRKPGSPKDPLKIEYWPLSRLRPYERNPRKNDKAVDRMRASIREYGFAVPILARSDGEVVDGHLRLKAAIAEKMAMVPVIVCDRWTAAQVKAFRLMANRSVDWAEWDLDALALEFGELKALEFDLSLTGFDKNEIDSFTLQPNAAEDDVPPVPDVATTKPGDLWMMGGHRLLCGDATDAASSVRLLGETKPFLMVTDPPYGVNYDPATREGVGAFGTPGVGNANLKQTGRVANDNRADWRDAYALFPGSVAYVWHASLMTIEAGVSLKASGFEVRGVIIWRKQQALIGRGHYHWQHEPCWYAVRINHRANWHGDRKQSTVWDVPNLNPTGNRQEEKTGHGTQKPVELMRRPIINHTVPGDAVYDPFLGSGTTLIAAEATERRCFGMEIDPTYCDIIISRWEKFTGRKAILESRL